MKTIKNMTADQLRKSILQLAIQGKLVKQDPKDEPASVLVEKIYEEKKKLIAEGKIKKEKVESRIFKGDDNRYYEKIGGEVKNITEEIPFEIPDSWRWVRLKYLSQFGMGQTILTKEMSNNGIPVYSATIDNKPLGYISKNLNKIKLSYDDLVIPARGNSIGHVTYIIDDEASCTQTTIWMKLYLKKISVFLFYFFLCCKNKLFVHNGAAIPQITIAKIQECLFPLPPLAEQERIVKEIRKYEPLIAEYDKLEKQLTKLENEITDKLKKSILQYAIEGKLVKQDPNDEPASVLLEKIKAEKEKLIREGKIKRDKNESYIYQGDDKNYYEKNTKNNQILDISDYIFDIKKSWKWCTLGQLTKQITDGTHKTPEYTNTGIPFLSIQNISSGKFDLAHLKYISINEHKVLSKRCNPEVNDILLCRIGTLGKPIINKLDFEFSIFVSLGLIKLVLNEPLNYVYLVLSSPHISNFIDFIKVGGGTHTFKINVEDINKFPIPLPPLAEQQRIVNKVERLFNVL